jgi:hypothetical protein
MRFRNAALGTLVGVGFLVANGLDHDARIMDQAQQCAENEVLVETLSTNDTLIERVWACVPIDSVRPIQTPAAFGVEH